MTIRIAVDPRVLRAWRADEEASFEDRGHLDPIHPYVLLGRYKTVVAADTVAEAEALIASDEYHGDATGWDDRAAFRRAVARLTARLRADLAVANRTPR